uniref:Uncharacterized protein n=1 Tax=Glossina austeni TaxID=7395 RepID=A0A1A9VG60_GLOAU
MPISVPTMNLVGIVVSYSNTETPKERPKSCSSERTGSINNLSKGSLSLRVSHQSTWPSDAPEKNSVPLFELFHNTELTGSRSRFEFSLNKTSSLLSKAVGRPK